MLQKVLYRPNEKNKSLMFRYKKGDIKHDFSNKLLKVNFEPKVSDEIDYDLIQFGDSGMRFWVDYTSSKIKHPGLLQFLRGVIIKMGIGRISSMIRPKVRETLGPMDPSQIKECQGKAIQIHDFYRQNIIGWGDMTFNQKRRTLYCL
jgi:hypothetical protein